MADIKISELSSASVLQDNDNVELSQDISGTLISTKASLLALANKVASGVNYSSELKTDDKTLTGAINEKVGWKENTILGAKNRIPYPYYETSHTESGVTFTDNGDGSITIVTNGASTAAARFNLYGGQGNSNLMPNKFVGMRGSMVYSTGIYDSNVYIYCQPFEADYSAYDNINDDDGTGWIVTNRPLIRVAIYVKSGTILNTPITVYPMIRLANDTDATWAPYAPTNKELADNKVSWFDNGLIGAKNLNSFPYYHDSRTINSVVWTVNADGSVTANGKATGGNSGFACHSRIVGYANSLILPNGDYIVNGCPAGGGSNKYRIEVAITKNGSYSTLALDTGEGAAFTINGDDNYDDKAQIQIVCTVYNGITVSNLTFYPMIRIADDNDDTWRPYAPTNRELFLSKPNPEAIAPVEYSPTRRNHSQGDFIMYNGQLYKCLTSITSGSALVVGTNIQATNVVSEMGSASGGTLVSGTLTAGNTSITLSDASITTNSWISPYTSVYGVNPTNISVSTGSVTLTFQAQATDVVVGVEVK